jgi:hypothetical protein
VSSALELVLVRAEAEPQLRGAIIWFPERVIEEFGLTDNEARAIRTGDFTGVDMSEESRVLANRVFDLHDLHSGE